MEIRFLNVDLVIESAENLQPLIDDLEGDVRVLYHGEKGNGYDFVSFELSSPNYDRDVDGIIAGFCNLIENLATEARAIWDKSFSRKFDVGFSCGDLPRSYQTEIRGETIERIAKNGASIIVTIYPQNY